MNTEKVCQQLDLLTDRQLADRLDRTTIALSLLRRLHALLEAEAGYREWEGSWGRELRLAPTWPVVWVAGPDGDDDPPPATPAAPVEVDEEAELDGPWLGRSAAWWDRADLSFQELRDRQAEDLEDAA